jgi:hypothetical protein
MIGLTVRPLQHEMSNDNYEILTRLYREFMKADGYRFYHDTEYMNKQTECI